MVNLFNIAKSVVMLIATAWLTLAPMGARAEVIYNWVQSSPTEGIGSDVNIRIVLSDANAYSGKIKTCLLSDYPDFGKTDHCPGQPDSGLLEVMFSSAGIGAFDIFPVLGRRAGFFWDISVHGDGDTLTGTILVGDFEGGFHMASSSGMWTGMAGSDRLPFGIPIEGTFRRVPEPSSSALFGIALLAFSASFKRRKNQS
jgi:hypothetical protein